MCDFAKAIHEHVKQHADEYKKEVDKNQKTLAQLTKEADRLTYIEQPLGVPIAVERLCAEFRKDQGRGSLYETWHANIAAAFYDAYIKLNPNTSEGGQGIVMQIANTAATNFLNNLCSHTQPKPKQ